MVRFKRSFIFLAAALSFTSPLHSATRQVSIQDPNYKIAAYDVTIPSNWRFDGAFIGGTTCFQAPFPVFRASSPDGLTEMRRYPRLDWTWNNLSGGAKHPDCLQLNQALTAKQALNYFMGLLQVTYTRDAPLLQAALDAKQKQMNQLNEQNNSMAKMMKLQPIVQTADFAAAYGESRNGSFLLETKFQIEVDCTRTPLPVFGQQGRFTEMCSATIRIDRAPKGKLAQVDWVHLGAVENSAWVTRYMQDAMARSNAAFHQRMQAMDRAAAIRTQQHEQFMAAMQANGQRFQQRMAEQTQVRENAASDWVDYALDRQTVTGSGGTVHVSNQYSHVWSNGADHYGTNWSSDDPNGFLPGAWTEQTKVHGNGQPYP